MKIDLADLFPLRQDAAQEAVIVTQLVSNEKLQNQRLLHTYISKLF